MTHNVKILQIGHLFSPRQIKDTIWLPWTNSNGRSLFGRHPKKCLLMRQNHQMNKNVWHRFTGSKKRGTRGTIALNKSRKNRRW